jgi:hypothetical protein
VFFYYLNPLKVKTWRENEKFNFRISFQFPPCLLHNDYENSFLPSYAIFSMLGCCCCCGHAMRDKVHLQSNGARGVKAQ